MTSWLILLDENPGLRPIGMGGVLCRIEREIVMHVAREDIQQAALQVCAEQDAVAEASIHAMYYLHQQDEVEAILLVDAENAFNSINRK